MTFLQINGHLEVYKVIVIHIYIRMRKYTYLHMYEYNRTDNFTNLLGMFIFQLYQQFTHHADCY